MKLRYGGAIGPGVGLENYRPQVLVSFNYPIDRQEEEGLIIKEDLLEEEKESLNCDMEYFRPEYIKFCWCK